MLKGLLLTLMVFFACAATRADVYQITYLSYNHLFPAGLTSDGTVVIVSQGCDQDEYSCFTIVPPNGPEYQTKTDTQFTFDNGAFCSDGNRCNGPYETAFTRPYDGTLQLTTRNGTQTFAAPGWIYNNNITDVDELNSMGDFVFDTDSGESFNLAYDLTTRQTPEPSTFVLLTTGLFGVVSARLRRVRAI